MPMACAATEGRDLLSEANSTLSPSPGSPIRLPRGTRTPSKAMAAVDAARWPIFSSSRTTSKPGVSRSISRTEIAALGSSMPSHLPNTSRKSATSPLEMNTLSPETTISSPSARNRVRICVASDPAPASVIASAPIEPSATRGSTRWRNSSEPMSITGFMPWNVVA